MTGRTPRETSDETALIDMGTAERLATYHGIWFTHFSPTGRHFLTFDNKDTYAVHATPAWPAGGDR